MYTQRGGGETGVYGVGWTTHHATMEKTMDRRKFLIGVGGTAIGGSALLGTGAFSRVESQRMVDIQVAQDSDAYLGLERKETPNSRNYTGYDDKGHLYIDIGENPNDGEGVNSDSDTWFDDLFRMCNNGKEDAHVYIDTGDLDLKDNAVVRFYTGAARGSQGDDGVTFIATSAAEEYGELLELPLGECEQIGLKTETHSVDATEDGPLATGEVRIVADVDLDD